MTQLLLFPAATEDHSSASRAASPAPKSRQQASSHPRAMPVELQRPLPQLSRSVPLYDGKKGELHHIGDLAQLVLQRYDIVAQRRAVLLARGPRQAARA
ncbi:hypothetical protein FF011L_18360 [Roseimaritima multifibrata]|uniref:Uncharacterized protein n=1 Tax=Roseimaritima multifibrata TaxID=1930274 RepID=A0A517MDX1_9BACT|nr:hypothetical protein [Roseimaritima multifibrata]QDS93081.1 hypothetical protein FF011L_18360 [Roseimaritima multifibrata]